METIVMRTRLIAMLHAQCWPLLHIAVSCMHTLHEHPVFRVYQLGLKLILKTFENTTSTVG